MKHTLFFLLAIYCFSAQAQNLKEANEFIENFQFEKALSILTQLNDSVNVHIPLQKGYCYSRLGNYESAIESYRHVLELDTANRIALMQLGQIYLRSSQYAMAGDCYKKLIASDSLNSYYYKQYAVSSAAANEDSLAFILYSKTLSLNPKDMESYNSLGNILLESENYKPLDSMINRALTVDSLQSSILLLKAKSQYSQGKYKATIATINKILERSSALPVYIKLLGTSSFHIKDYSRTVDCMNFLLAAGTKNDWAYYYLGASYREMHDLPKSIEFMSKAIEAGISDNIEIYYLQLAKTYEDSKDFKNAIHYYQAAYEMSKSKILLYHLARNYDIYFKDKSMAIAYYKKYLSTDDTIKLAREYSKRRLDSLE